jgi:four helix bundle protein
MSNQAPNTNNKMTKFDLEERTTKLGKSIIMFLKEISETTMTKPIISQLLRSATSIGANYCEADDAESKKDFEHKLGICKKEARETKYWLEMLKTIKPELSGKINLLAQEAKELNLIFNAIINKTKNRII